MALGLPSEVLACSIGRSLRKHDVCLFFFFPYVSFFSLFFFHVLLQRLPRSHSMEIVIYMEMPIANSLAHRNQKHLDFRLGPPER